MKDRNKILTQILNVTEEYDLDIININFTSNVLKDAVVITYKDDYGKSLVIYSYEKDDIYEVNSFGRYFRDELDRRLMEDK